MKMIPTTYRGRLACSVLVTIVSLLCGRDGRDTLLTASVSKISMEPIFIHYGRNELQEGL